MQLQADPTLQADQTQQGPLTSKLLNLRLDKSMSIRLLEALQFDLRRFCEPLDMVL